MQTTRNMNPVNVSKVKTEVPVALYTQNILRKFFSTNWMVNAYAFYQAANAHCIIYFGVVDDAKAFLSKIAKAPLFHTFIF